MLKVRRLEHADIEQVFAMSKAMHEESPRFRDKPFREEKAQALIGHLIAVGGGFVADLDGVLVGMVGGMLVEHFFSSQKFSTDLVVYVLPAFRGSSAGVRLIAAYEEWAFANGAEEVGLGVSAGVEQERTVCIYERLGYKMASYTLIKRKE